MNNKIKTLLKSGLMLGAFALSLTAFAVWTAPTQNPTAGNVEPPINTSTSSQVKAGGFGVKVLQSYGLTSLATGSHASVGIGTTAPPFASGLKLDVIGNTRIRGGLQLQIPLAPGQTAPAQGDVLSLADAQGNVKWTTPGGTGGGGTIGGSGALNKVAKFTPDGTTIASSQIFDNGTNVGVGTVAPSSSAILDLTSTTKGFLAPRMTRAQRIAIPSAANGLLVYQNDNTQGLYYKHANGWNSVLRGLLNGNGDPEGVNNYLTKWTGTNTSAITNSTIYDDSTGVGIGTTSPLAKLDVAGSIKIGDNSSGCSSTNAGTQRYNTGIMYYCNGTTWVAMSGGGSVGPGTLNRLAKFTPNGTTLGDSSIVENNLGNVGIGITTQPTAKLEVNGTTKITGPFLMVSNDSYFAINSGNVGVGINDLATAKLDVGGTIRIRGGNPGVDKVLTGIDSDGNARWTLPVPGGTIGGSGTLNYLPKFTPNGTTLGSSSIFANDNGNIGIGTPNPTQKLTVIGNALIQGTAGYNNTNEEATLYLGDTGTPAIKAVFGSGVRLGANGAANALSISQGTGNVGIGTINPGAKLEVAGQVKITGGSPGAGKVLTSDVDGLATWQPATGVWTQTEQNISNSNSGNVGIGTNILNSKFNVLGTSNFDGLLVAKKGVSLSADTGFGTIIGPLSGSSTETKLTVNGKVNIKNNLQVDGKIGIGVANPIVPLEVVGTAKISGNVIIPGTSDVLNVGPLGAYDTGVELKGNGKLKIVDNTQGNGKVLTSDANGNTSWQGIAFGGVYTKGANNSCVNANVATGGCTCPSGFNAQPLGSVVYAALPDGNSGGVGGANITSSGPLYMCLKS